MLSKDLDLFEDYLIAERKSKRTGMEYLYNIKRFFNEYSEFNEDNITNFLERRQNNNSIARASLVNFKKYLLTHSKPLGVTPQEKLKIKSIEIKKVIKERKELLVRYLTLEQIERVRDKLPLIKNVVGSNVGLVGAYQLMMDLSFYGGLRIGGLFRLRLSSFNIEKWKKDKQIDQEAMCEVLVYEKGKKEGLVLMPARIIYNVQRYIRDNASLFAMKGSSQENSYLFTPTKDRIIVENVSRDWQRKLRQAGIDAGIETPVHPHRLRHSFAIYLLIEKGLDIRVIQEALRHSSIVSTQIYTKLDKKALRKALKGL